MPYIKQADRYKLANGSKPSNAGELNYSITLIIIAAVRNIAPVEVLQTAVYELLTEYCSKELNYQKINDCMGASLGAVNEYGRRNPDAKQPLLVTLGTAMGKVLVKFYTDVAAPYEDTKIEANGDVYGD